MPFKGTDLEAYKKAGRNGKTAKQRSVIYHREKKKNEIKRGIIGLFSFPSRNSIKIPKNVKSKYIPNETVLDVIRKYRSSKFVSNISNSFSVVLVKTFGKQLSSKEKDIVRSTIALVISESLNQALQKPLNFIENIKMFIKLGKVVYKVILKFNEYAKEYEIDANNVFKVDGKNSEYREFLLKYPKLKNKYEFNSDLNTKKCPLCNSKLDLIIENNIEFYVCCNYLDRKCTYKVMKG